MYIYIYITHVSSRLYRPTIDTHLLYVHIYKDQNTYCTYLYIYICMCTHTPSHRYNANMRQKKHMGVSTNGGTSTWMVYKGKSFCLEGFDLPRGIRW